MKRSSQQTLVMTGLALLVVIMVVALFVGLRHLASWNIPGDALGTVYSFSTRLRNGFSGAIRGFRGDDDLLRLQSENLRLQTEIAALSDVAEENVFLRQISELPARRDYRTIPSGIFSYAISGQEVQVTVNVGSRDGVIPGGAVVTESGALLGFVRDVREQSSTVLVLGDPSLQVTGRIAGRETGGLVRTDGTGQVALDLIAKDEVVEEGERVVTSGLDNAPPGLVIGTVRSVDPESTTLFQHIRLSVAHEFESVWRVIILVP